jgi:hypothetical protein
MILYVNGDSHTAAAEAVNPHCFAEDDGNLYMLGRNPHPANLAVSWGQKLAKLLNAEFYSDAESAASNARIMRTTRDWIHKNYDRLDRTIMVIQWSTWEREEWLIDGVYYQITASGTDDVPSEHQPRYKEFIAVVDWQQEAQQAHDDIWQFHLELLQQQTPHVFFNGNNSFDTIVERKDWGNSYIDPYISEGTFDQRLRNAGFDTVNPKSWHFGAAAHCFWAQSMLQYVVNNNLG